MEKLVYALWKPPDISHESFKRRLVDEIAPALLAEQAADLRVAAVDDAVAAGTSLRLDSMDPPKDALVSFWLEQSQERGACERRLARASERVAGYLVVESRPLVSPHAPRRPGERSPGFSLCTCVVARDDISRARFLELWYDVQRDTAIETQSTFSYVRNEVVRPLTAGAPEWTAIVEEGFPIGALDDPAVFYDAVGDPDRLAANQRRMFESCRGFLALERVDSHPMSEYTFGPARPSGPPQPAPPSRQVTGTQGL